MCGIFCSICNDSQTETIDVKLIELLKNRGPDNYSIVSKNNILFGGFVLWQQGETLTPQPVCMNNWTLLLNGDIFNHDIDDGTSDTTWLIRKISSCTNDDDLIGLFKSLKGPYSVIIYDEKNENLYFARDSLGRNSLIVERDHENLRILSNSYIPETKMGRVCMELPSYGIYKINLKNTNSVSLYPWIELADESKANLLSSLFSEVLIERCINPEWLSESTSCRTSFDFYEMCGNKPQEEDLYPWLIADKSVNRYISEFLDLLRKSVRERVAHTPKFCTSCIEHLKPSCDHSKVAILFSGGIDCTILAVIASEFVNPNESIDLINVAFEAVNSKQINWEVPDRCSARESYAELQMLFPMRKWNLIEVNITRKDLSEQMHLRIKHLIYPLNTILDESLGCTFWYASRGYGHCNDEPYKTTTRVVLVGIGADELFGGYTRHRNAYFRCPGTHSEKIENLWNELEKDWKRLPTRNMGRDDRVIADNGKTSRAPFIQEDIIQFVSNLKPEQRCCYALERGVGDKLFLRLCGYQLGLRTSVVLKKRAIQFGSRIADKKQNANDISANLQ